MLSKLFCALFSVGLLSAAPQFNVIARVVPPGKGVNSFVTTDAGHPLRIRSGDMFGLIIAAGSDATSCRAVWNNNAARQPGREEVLQALLPTTLSMVTVDYPYTCADATGATTTASAWVQIVNKDNPVDELGVVHGATFQSYGIVAPMEIATIMGTGFTLNPAAIFTANGQLPTSALDVEVLVNGAPAQLYYVSNTQINFVVPLFTPFGNIQVHVRRKNQFGSLIGDIMTVTVKPLVPGFFQSGGTAIIQYANEGKDKYTTSGKDTPATVYSSSLPSYVLILWATGLGIDDPSTNPVRKMTGYTFKVLLDNKEIPNALTYVGPSQFPGLDQINLQVPKNLVGTGIVSDGAHLLMVTYTNTKDPADVGTIGTAYVYLR